MIPLKLKWASQQPLNIARDPELLDLAARSGCVSLSIGLESINEESLDSIKKGFNLPKRFSRDLTAIRTKGIQVIALLMVGLDGDTLDTFQRSLQFLIDNKISFLKLFHTMPVSRHALLRRHRRRRPHHPAAIGTLRLRCPLIRLAHDGR